MGILRRCVALAVVGSVLVACSLSTSLDGLMGGDDGNKPLVVTDPPSDAAKPSVPLPGPSFPIGDGGASVPEAGAPAPPSPGTNLHPYGTFDTSCDGWYASQSVTQLSATAHTPPGACQVCTASGATAYFGISDYGVVSKPPVGASYHVTGWLRAAPTQTPAKQLSVMLRTFDTSGGFAQIELAQSAELATVDTTWQKIEVTLEVTKPAEWLHVNFVGVPSGSQCFLVDDVVLERLR